MLRITRGLLAPAFLSIALAGCNWSQSTLAPNGSEADAIATLSWVMFIGGGLIFLATMATAALAIFAGERWRKLLGRRSFIVASGIAFPIVVLTALLIYGLLTQGLRAGPAAGLRVEVTGERWWWRVNYLDRAGKVQFTTANEIRVPVGAEVEFVLKTADVIHSFWVPSLAGKLDMIPGRVNAYSFRADRAGVYRGQCAEYCGEQHALMAFYVVAEPTVDFERWRNREAGPAVASADPQVLRGRDLFLANGCGACHAVRGTEANGVVGPDLTHVGSRLSLAAGTFPNNVGTLAGWVASAQHLKPENGMPSFAHLSGEELRAVAAYLESLK